METGLKVKLGADITELTAGFAKADSTIKLFGKNVSDLTNTLKRGFVIDTSGIIRAANEGEGALRTLDTAIKGVSTTTIKVNTDTSQIEKLADSANSVRENLQKGFSANAAPLTSTANTAGDAIKRIGTEATNSTLSVFRLVQQRAILKVGADTTELDKIPASVDTAKKSLSGSFNVNTDPLISSAGKSVSALEDLSKQGFKTSADLTGLPSEKTFVITADTKPLTTLSDTVKGVQGQLASGLQINTGPLVTSINAANTSAVELGKAFKGASVSIGNDVENTARSLAQLTADRTIKVGVDTTQIKTGIEGTLSTLSLKDVKITTNTADLTRLDQEVARSKANLTTLAEPVKVGIDISSLSVVPGELQKVRAATDNPLNINVTPLITSAATVRDELARISTEVAKTKAAIGSDFISKITFTADTKPIEDISARVSEVQGRLSGGLSLNTTPLVSSVNAAKASLIDIAQTFATAKASFKDINIGVNTAGIKTGVETEVNNLKGGEIKITADVRDLEKIPVIADKAKAGLFSLNTPVKLGVDVSSLSSVSGELQKVRDAAGLPLNINVAPLITSAATVREELGRISSEVAKTKAAIGADFISKITFSADTKPIETIAQRVTDIQQRLSTGLTVNTTPLISSIEAAKASLVEIAQTFSATKASIKDIKIGADATSIKTTVEATVNSIKLDDVIIKADTSQLDKVTVSAATAQKQIGSLQSKSITVDVNTTALPGAIAGINTVETALAKIQPKTLFVNPTPLITSINAAKASTESFKTTFDNTASHIATIKVGTGSFDAVVTKVQSLNSAFNSVNATASKGINLNASATVTASTAIANSFGGITTRIAGLTSQLTTLKGQLATATNPAEVTRLTSSIALLDAQLTKLSTKNVTLTVASNASSLNLSPLIANTETARQTFVGLRNEIGSTGSQIQKVASALPKVNLTAGLKAGMIDFGAALKAGVNSSLGGINNFLVKVGANVQPLASAVNQTAANLSANTKITVPVALSTGSINLAPLVSSASVAQQTFAQLKAQIASVGKITTNVTINANTSQLQTNLSKGATSISAFQSKTQALQAQLATMRASLASATDPQAITRLTNGIGVLQGQLSKLNTQSNSFVPIKSGIVGATAALTTFAGAVKNSVGAGFTNTFRALGTGFSTVGTGIRTVAGGMVASFGAIRTGAAAVGGSLLSATTGIGGLADVMVLAGVGLAGFASKMFEASASSIAAAASLKDYNSAMASAAGNVAKETSSLTALLAVAQNENLSRSQRQKAIDELQKTYPAYLGNLTIENSKSKDIAASVDSIVAALGRKSKVEALSALIGKETEKSIEAQNGKAKEQLDIFDKIDGVFRSLKGKSIIDTRFKDILKGVDVSLEQKGREKLNQVATTSTNLAEQYRKELAALTVEQAINNDSLGQSAKAHVEHQKAVKVTTDYYAELLKQLASINNSVGIGVLSPSKADEERLSAYQSTLDKVFKAGYTATSPLVIKLNAEIQPIQTRVLEAAIQQAGLKALALGDKSLVLPIPVLPEVVIDKSYNGDEVGRLFQAQREVIINKLRALGVKSITSTQKLKIELETAGDADLKSRFDSALAEIASFRTKAQDIMGQTGADLFGALGEGLAGAIDGDGLKAIFAPIFQIVGQAFRQLGQAMIIESAAIKALKKAFTNPAASLVAGIALVAAGTLLSKSIPKFATGGVVTSSMVGQVGEAGPEAIIPLDRLPKLVSQMAGANTGSSSIEVTGRFELLNDRLVAAVERGMASNGRKF